MEVSARGREAGQERSRMRVAEQRARGRVPVVYYLSRNGKLEHPHFMEVPLSAAAGLHLRDVLDRFDFLRGKGMAAMYSWSYKRSYKNGFVWHDLCDDDLIQLGHGDDYILKGSELLYHPPLLISQKSQGAAGSPEIPKPDSDSPTARWKHAAWGSRSLDLGEYKVYKNELTAVSAVNAADAATQTDDRRRRRRAQATDDEGDLLLIPRQQENTVTELGRDDISPPLSASSPETLETLIKADRGVIGAAADVSSAADGSGSGHSGRFRSSASAVVMHLISCGSFSLAPPFRTGLPRDGPPDDREIREMNGSMEGRCMRVEEKEFYSGSLVEMKTKSDGADCALKRSSSYNAEKSLGFEVEEVEKDGFQARCTPRMPKAKAKEGNGLRAKQMNDQGTTVGSREKAIAKKSD